MQMETRLLSDLSIVVSGDDISASRTQVEQNKYGAKGHSPEAVIRNPNAAQGTQVLPSVENLPEISDHDSIEDQANKTSRSPIVSGVDTSLYLNANNQSALLHGLMMSINQFTNKLPNVHTTGNDTKQES